MVEQSQNRMTGGIKIDRAKAVQALTKTFTTNTYIWIKTNFLLNELFTARAANITEMINAVVKRTDINQRLNKIRRDNWSPLWKNSLSSCRLIVVITYIYIYICRLVFCQKVKSSSESFIMSISTLESALVICM